IEVIKNTAVVGDRGMIGRSAAVEIRVPANATVVAVIAPVVGNVGITSFGTTEILRDTAVTADAPRRASVDDRGSCACQGVRGVVEVGFATESAIGARRSVIVD